MQRMFITEIASPVLWHFTTIENLISILEYDAFRLEDARTSYHKQDIMLTGYSSRHPYYFSTTRSKSSHDGYSRSLKHKSDIGCARIQLNGDKLNHIAHIKAADYHGKESTKYNDLSLKGHYIENFRKGYYKMSNIKNDKAYDGTEKEDTVWYRESMLENASKYIQRIDVLLYKNDDSLVEEIEDLCYDLNISVYFYDEEEAFNLQSNDYFDEDRYFQKRLNNAKKYIENGRSRYDVFDEINELQNGWIVRIGNKYNAMEGYNGDLVSDEWFDDYYDAEQALEKWLWKYENEDD